MAPGGAPYGLIEGGAIAVRGGRIAAVGRAADAAPGCRCATSAAGW